MKSFLSAVIGMFGLTQLAYGWLAIEAAETAMHEIFAVLLIGFGGVTIALAAILNQMGRVDEPQQDASGVPQRL